MTRQENIAAMDWLSLVFLFGVFFSSITFNITPGETSALAGLSGFLILLQRGTKKTVQFIFYSTTLLLFSGYSLLFSYSNLYEVVKQFFAYLQIVAVFLCAGFIRFKRMERYLIAWVALDLLVYAIQFTGIGSQIIEPMMSSLISRGTAVQLIDSGRGIAGFTSEPSQMATSVFVHAFLLLYCGRVNGRDYSVFCIVYILTAIVLSASGTGVALLMVFAIPFILNKLKLTLFGGAVLLGLLYFLPLPGRLVEIINLLQTLSGETIVSAFYISGFRFPSVGASYAYASTEITFGGVGSWYTRILEAYDYIGVDIRSLGHFEDFGDWGPTKPSSLFAAISLEFGIYGLIFSAVMLCVFIKKYQNIAPEFKAYFLVAIFGAFVLSTVGNPTFPFVLALGVLGKLNSFSVKTVLSESTSVSRSSS